MRKHDTLSVHLTEITSKLTDFFIFAINLISVDANQILYLLIFCHRTWKKLEFLRCERHWCRFNASSKNIVQIVKNVVYLAIDFMATTDEQIKLSK